MYVKMSVIHKSLLWQNKTGIELLNACEPPREMSKTSCSLAYRREPQESLLKFAYIPKMFSYLAFRPTEKSHRRSGEEGGGVRKLLELSQIWESLFPE